MGSEQNRFPQQVPPPPPRRKRWGGCWSGSSCFGSQKGGKRVAPASRIPEANALGNQPNGPQVAGLSNQTTAIHPSLLAPPSSPASFSNSALQSTAQSPNNFLSLSANSPGGPSSSMFATGPYANDTQLVSPPVFSAFTTEPSTAPFTPPPELAHVTTPSSPDVPYAHFLSSSVDHKSRDKANYFASSDLHATYSLYPGSPTSSLRSPVSRNSGDCLSSSSPNPEFASQWDSAAPQELKHPRSESGRNFGLDTTNASKLSQDSNFFCPATFAQFYLDQSSFSQSGGRLSVSKDTDVYSNGGTGHQNKQNKASKQDVEEIEAYRASFGFSADEIVTTAQYVEITDVTEDSFTMNPFTSCKPEGEENAGTTNTNLPSPNSWNSNGGYVNKETLQKVANSSKVKDHATRMQHGDVSLESTRNEPIMSDNEDIFAKMGTSRISRKYHMGLSNSDAEVDYRRGRSLREGRGKGDLAWHV